MIRQITAREWYKSEDIRQIICRAGDWDSLKYMTSHVRAREQDGCKDIVKKKKIHSEQESER